MVKVMPGTIIMPVPRRPKCSTSGSSWNCIPYAMSAEITDYAESVLFGMFLNGSAYITQLFPRLGGGNAYFHTFFGDLYQLSVFQG